MFFQTNITTEHPLRQDIPTPTTNPFDLIPIELTTLIVIDTAEFKAIVAQCCRLWRSIILTHQHNYNTDTDTNTDTDIDTNTNSIHQKPPKLFVSSVVQSLSLIARAKDNGCPFNEYLCAHAAKVGNLHVLKYLCDNGCPWGESTCTIAAKEGHLHILQWLHANGYPWDNKREDRTDIHSHRWDEMAYTYAAAKGHLHILKYLKDNGCP